MGKSTFHVAATVSSDVAPTYAKVRIQVNVRSEDKTTAYSEAFNAHTAVVNLLRTRVGGSAFSTSAPRSYSYQGRFDEEESTLYVTSSEIIAEFEDFDSMADTLAILALETYVSYSVSWHLSAALQAREETNLRAVAVDKARKIAEDYAVAAGYPTDRLTLKSLRDQPRAGGSHLIRSAAVGSSASATPPAFETLPADITVSSTIEAVYVVKH